MEISKCSLVVIFGRIFQTVIKHLPKTSLGRRGLFQLSQATSVTTLWNLLGTYKGSSHAIHSNSLLFLLNSYSNLIPGIISRLCKAVIKLSWGTHLIQPKLDLDSWPY